MNIQVITTSASEIPNGWLCAIFLGVLALVGFYLSVHWKLKLEHLQEKTWQK